MKKSFDTFEYIQDLGEDLVRSFEKAGKTTHPHSVGGGKEKGAISKLQNILPSGVGVGRGFIIDSFGNTTSQCDIVIYEKDLCLKFNEDDEDNCYYNCESVIAVGEVKSRLDKDSLVDSITKFQRIRKLRRKVNNHRNFRPYLSKMSLYGAENECYNQNTNCLDQIFTFLLCESFALSCEKIIEIILEDKNISNYPNIVLSVDGTIIDYCKRVESGDFERTLGALDGDFFAYGKAPSSFSILLQKLFFFIEHGRSVKYKPDEYIVKPETCSVKIVPLEEGDKK